MYSHWESEIFASLSTRRINLPFYSMQELITNTDMKVMTVLGTSLSNSFEYSKDYYRSRIWQERMKPNAKIFDKYGLKGLKDLMLEEESYTIFQSFIVYALEPEFKDCKIVAAPGRYDHQQVGYGLQKDSPYLFIFNHFIQEMKEKGAIDRILKQYLISKQICSDYSGQPLSISTCVGAFIVVIVGVAFSIMLLLTEGAAKILKKKNFLTPITLLHL